MYAAETKEAKAPLSTTPKAKPPAVWKQIVAPLEPFLKAVEERLVHQVQAFDPEIAKYAEYALANQGKQLRPVLVGLSAGATGGIQDRHVTVAVIIEMVHLATLVHDDVMDEASVRRRRPTMAANWGNQISVLVGDCLFAHALELAAGFPTPEICRAVASASNTVCAGEILQTNARFNFGGTREEYFKIVAMKTAEFFALACDLGAYLNDVSSARRTALRDYGMSLGTAYQIYDDCLDLFGSETAAGKSLGTDLTNGKLTLPLLEAMEQAGKAERTRLQSMIMEATPENHRPILEILRKYDSLQTSRGVIRRYIDAAQNSLEVLPETASRAALVALTEFLAHQTGALGISG